MIRMLCFKCLSTNGFFCAILLFQYFNTFPPFLFDYLNQFVNSDGLIFDITREDGYPFGAHRLDIKYHNS